MPSKLIHATHDGSHLYKFVGMHLVDIEKLRGDGAPVDTSWLPAQSYGGVDRFFRFDHEVQAWTMVEQHDEGCYLRIEQDAPFKTDLPEMFENVKELAAFAAQNGLADRDEDGEIYHNLVLPFYRWHANMVPSERPHEFEVCHLGEITPCPKVTFQWVPIQPHEVGIPEEMWHLGPVQVEKGHLRDLFWKWVEENKGQLCIKSMYPRQKEATVFFEAEGGPTRSIDVYRDPDFLALLGNMQGKDLIDLQLNLAARMMGLQKMMTNVSPSHECPRCSGTGALPCPRCGGAGMTDKGNLAEAVLQDALFRVRQIKGSRGDEKENDAIHAVERLAKFFLPGDVEE